MTSFEEAMKRLDEKESSVLSEIAKRHQQLDERMREAERKLAAERKESNDFHKKIDDLMKIVNNL